jgi:hypothetical protein
MTSSGMWRHAQSLPWKSQIGHSSCIALFRCHCLATGLHATTCLPVYLFKCQINAVAPPYWAFRLVVASLHIRQALPVHLTLRFNLFVVSIIMILCVTLVTRTQKQNLCTSSSENIFVTALDCCCNTSAGHGGIHNQVIAWGVFYLHVWVKMM